MLGDEAELAICVDAGADNETLAAAREFGWAHGRKRVAPRVARAGLISAVVESWTPRCVT